MKLSLTTTGAALCCVISKNRNGIEVALLVGPLVILDWRGNNSAAA